MLHDGPCSPRQALEPILNTRQVSLASSMAGQTSCNFSALRPTPYGASLCYRATATAPATLLTSSYSEDVIAPPLNGVNHHRQKSASLGLGPGSFYGPISTQRALRRRASASRCKRSLAKGRRSLPLARSIPRAPLARAPTAEVLSNTTPAPSPQHHRRSTRVRPLLLGAWEHRCLRVGHVQGQIVGFQAEPSC